MAAASDDDYEAQAFETLVDTEAEAAEAPELLVGEGADATLPPGAEKCKALMPKWTLDAQDNADVACVNVMKLIIVFCNSFPKDKKVKGTRWFATKMLDKKKRREEFCKKWVEATNPYNDAILQGNIDALVESKIAFLKPMNLRAKVQYLRENSRNPEQAIQNIMNYVLEIHKNAILATSGMDPNIIRALERVVSGVDATRYQNPDGSFNAGMLNLKEMVRLGTLAAQEAGIDPNNMDNLRPQLLEMLGRFTGDPNGPLAESLRAEGIDPAMFTEMMEQASAAPAEAPTSIRTDDFE